MQKCSQQQGVRGHSGERWTARQERKGNFNICISSGKWLGRCGFLGESVGVGGRTWALLLSDPLTFCVSLQDRQWHFKQNTSFSGDCPLHAGLAFLVSAYWVSVLISCLFKLFLSEFWYSKYCMKIWLLNFSCFSWAPFSSHPNPSPS